MKLLKRFLAWWSNDEEHEIQAALAKAGVKQPEWLNTPEEMNTALLDSLQDAQEEHARMSAVLSTLNVEMAVMHNWLDKAKADAAMHFRANVILGQKLAIMRQFLPVSNWDRFETAWAEHQEKEAKRLAPADKPKTEERKPRVVKIVDIQRVQLESGRVPHGHPAYVRGIDG